VSDSVVVDGQQVRVEVLEALRRLGVRQRAVIFFTYWHDLESTEVARLLGISSRTVQRELTAARRHLEVLLT
jgi:RNA polymerase sigma factor (sigma-70 family)